jgi:hypothetical protein
MLKRTLLLTLAVLTGLAHANEKPLIVGTTAAFAIPLETAVEEAKKQGLSVKLVEFTDWIAPNVSLATPRPAPTWRPTRPASSTTSACTPSATKASTSCPTARPWPLPTTRSTAVAACNCWPRQA